MSEESNENDFWYEFDNTFNGEMGANEIFSNYSSYIIEISTKYGIGSLNSNDLMQILQTNTEDVINLKKAIKGLAPKYVDQFTRYLGNDFGSENFEYGSKSFDLFSDFGQGRLYDPRRSVVRRMHVMDTYELYYVWHRFNWMAYLLNIEFANTQFPNTPFVSQSSLKNWLYLDRLVGAAAEIHSIAQPDQSCNTTGNPPPDPQNGDVLSINKINSIGSNWKNYDFEQIETRLATLTPYESQNRCENKPRPDIL